ncbi:MAG: hypothetical protein ABWZ52_02405 [Acidimicrobiales bacterium]
MTTRTKRSPWGAAAVAGVLLLSGCGDDDTTTAGPSPTATQPTEPVIDPGDGGDYAPALDPADFVDGIDNPYLPLIPGTKWVYEGEDDGEAERVEVEVLDERREIEGITATVVQDTVYVDGELAEDTFDWYAQDKDGNVWYLGEDTHEYEDGVAVNAAGAWEYGKDGALPGIVMPAHPEVGDAYRQEYYKGEAEDMGKVLEAGVTQEIELGTYDDVLVTQDWTPLEPEVVEEKSYAPGVGLIGEVKTAGGEGEIELIEFTPAG